MLPKFQTLVKIGLVSCILVTIGLSIVDVSIPPVGKYWNGIYIGGRFFLFHPIQFLDIAKFSIENPAIVDWVIQHANELSGILGNEEILSLVVENPWLFEFIKGIYDADPDFLLNLEIERLGTLLTWVIEHPQYRETLLKHPDFAIKLLENDFDETIFISRIKITYPLPFSMVHRETRVNVTAYSPEGIRSIEVTWNSTGSTGFVASQQNSSLSATWNTSLLPSGYYTLNAVAETGNGTVIRDSVTLIISNAPRLWILSPLAGSVVGGNFSVQVKVESFAPVADCTASLEGVGGVYIESLNDPDGDGVYLGYFDTSTVVDGDYSLNVTVVDVDGSSSSSRIYLEISNVPQLRITFPEDGSIVGGKFNVTVSITSFDPISTCVAKLSSIDHVYVYNLTDADGDGVYVGAIDSNTVFDDDYSLSVTAVDVDGSWNSSAISVTVSNVPQLWILSPLEGGAVDGNFSVVVEVSSYRLISECKATINLQEFVLTDSDGDNVFNCTIDSLSFDDGVYTITVSVKDALGSANSSQINVKIDNVPSVELRQPGEDVFVEGDFTIEAGVTSLDAIQQVVAYLDDALVGALSDPDGDGSYTLTLDSTAFTEYYHNIYVKATDEQGLSNSSQIHRIKVDNLASQVVILKPVNGSAITGPYMDVNATINDFTNWVRVYINGVPVVYRTYSNEYVTTVAFRIDTSDMIFYTSVTMITVGYESALGHTNSTWIVVYKQAT